MVTTTMSPRLASRARVVDVAAAVDEGAAVDPHHHRPRFAPTGGGVHTLRVRQSSLVWRPSSDRCWCPECTSGPGGWRRARRSRAARARAVASAAARSAVRRKGFRRIGDGRRRPPAHSARGGLHHRGIGRHVHGGGPPRAHPASSAPAASAAATSRTGDERMQTARSPSLLSRLAHPFPTRGLRHIHSELDTRQVSVQPGE